MQTTRREFLKKVGIGAAAVMAPTVVWTPANAQDRKFTMYLTVLNNNQTRMIWSNLIGQNIAKLGVEVVTSYIPVPELYRRRANDTGATFLEGGFDMYTERMYYGTLSPQPETMFSKAYFPPNGMNYYRIDDEILEEAMQTYSGSPDPDMRADAMQRFQRRWYDIEPLHIIYYPEDLIVTNPALKGFAETTYRPVFFPRAENWTIEGATGDTVTAIFASWPAPGTLVPFFTGGYHETNISGPIYNSLVEYDSWESKKPIPALAESITRSDDGLVWKIKLREGVLWHSGEPFTAEDVKYTWDTILGSDVVTVQDSIFKEVFGSADTYRIVSPLEIEVTLPAYNVNFEQTVLITTSILPKHAYDSIDPSKWRDHVSSNWNGTFTVTLSSGETYEAKGGIGTGPWIADGFDPDRSAYRMRKNPNFWRETPGNVNEFYVVNIEGTDAVLSALRSGSIDAHDPMYDITTLVETIDPSWGTVHKFDSFKWQQTCINLAHPVFGTGVDTPLGKADPSKASEAAAFIRKAFSHAIPREEIIRNLLGGYGVSGTVPIAVTSAEYDKDYLKPIAYDMELAKEYMKKAGYTY